jgi:hypothetical protein
MPNETMAVADREVAVAEEREGHQRLRLDAVPEDEERQENGPGKKETGNAEEAPVSAGRIERRDIGEGAPVIPLPLDQPENHGEKRAAGEEDTNRIQVLLAAQADAGKQPDPQDEGNDADRNVDPEDGLPAEVGDEESPERRSGDRGDAGDRAPDPKGRAAPVRGKDVGEDAERLRRQDGAADALDHAGEDQLAGTLGEATANRGQGEDREPDQEQPPGAEHVAQSAGGDQQHRVDEDVCVQHPENLVQPGVQPIDNARDRDVHDGEIEQDHKEAKAEHEQDDPWTPFGLNRRLHMV